MPTPIGEYNPGWEIVWEELRIGEQRKIYCAEHHFDEALGDPYKVTDSAKGLM